MPSKTLRETALALSGIKSRNLYGVDLSLRREVTVADFMGHETHLKETFHESFSKRLREGNATVLCGTCALLDAHTVRVSLGSEDREKGPGSSGEEILLLVAKAPPPDSPAGIFYLLGKSLLEVP